MHGVLLLHSFTFENAEKTFKAALAAEPDFFMAYWGEALSHNHPLLPERNPDLPRAVLKRRGATREARLAKAPTEREKGFLAAVEILFGGSEEERATAYSEAMGELAANYPDDAEAQAFYAVSLLGRVRFTRDKDFRIRMKAGDRREHLPRVSGPSRRGALHHPFIRRSRARAARTDRGLPLCRDRSRRRARNSHAVAHLHPARREKATRPSSMAIYDERKAEDGEARTRRRVQKSGRGYVVESEQWKTEMLGEDATPEAAG